MGRYETLNPETQDVVEALLPALERAFKISDVKDIIPEDIRMRAWDCDRRDHIKELTEDEPRNWGVQFLKDLQAIARLLGGDLAKFQVLLRARVDKHADKHPWCRLADIKDLKAKLQNPGQDSDNDKQGDIIEVGSSGEDSYLEELVEPEIPKGSKRGRKGRGIEMYEARSQIKHRKRLRRADGSGWARPEPKNQAARPSYYDEYRPNGLISVRGESADSMSRRSTATPFLSETPVPVRHGRLSASMMRDIDDSDVPVGIQKIQAEIEAAEAELKIARAKVAYLDLKEKTQAEAEAVAKAKAKARSVSRSNHSLREESEER